MPDQSLKRLAALGSTTDTGRWILAALEGVQESSGEGRTDPGYFHPSDFGNECDAYMAFKFLGAPAVTAVSARLQRIFDLGHARDLGLKTDMSNSGISLITNEEQRKINIPYLHIRGELDDFIQHPITHAKYVIDFKTMNPTEWEALAVVKPSHHLQLHPYMYDKGVRQGFVLYENKGNQEIKLKKADFDQAIWREQFEDRVERILTALDEDYVIRNAARCSYCPFNANGTCTNNDIRGLKIRSGLYE